MTKYIEKYTPQKVLVIGNGFDIAHGLLTSYSDFLKIMKEPDEFLKYYNHEIKKTVPGIFENNNCWEEYLKLISDENQEDVNKLVSILKENSWAQYFANCNAEINGWVDFEHEMMPVIKMFNTIISKGSQNIGIDPNSYALVRIDDIGIGRISSLWPKYIKQTSSIDRTEIVLTIESSYSDMQYGVISSKLLHDLKTDLDKFVEAFGIYLGLFAEKCQKRLSLFEDMEVSHIINFNYTGTVYHYELLNKANMSYVHGSLANNGESKMILGVNHVENDAEYKFKEFEKRYQRLCNSTRQFYRKIIADENYELIFFGHSLDITDKSILEPLIRGAKKTEIHCYTDENGNSDINIKKKNLMLLLGDDDAEEMLYNEAIVLK